MPTTVSIILDEMLEFERRALGAFREPLEEGVVWIARAVRTVSLPVRFLLVGAMNPYPCGDRHRPCRCTPLQVERYRSRMSGPLLDRLDLFVVEVPALSIEELVDAPTGERPGVGSHAGL